MFSCDEWTCVPSRHAKTIDGFDEIGHHRLSPASYSIPSADASCWAYVVGDHVLGLHQPPVDGRVEPGLVAIIYRTKLACITLQQTH
jgi:hypothetical protein